MYYINCYRCNSKSVNYKPGVKLKIRDFANMRVLMNNLKMMTKEVSGMHLKKFLTDRFLG